MRIVVGTPECSLERLACCLADPKSLSLLTDKWTDIARELQSPSDRIKTLRHAILHEKRTLSDAIYEILEDWVSRCAKDATLKDFLLVLKKYELNSLVESIQKEFPAIKPSRKYDGLPAQLQHDFLPPTNGTKLVCIILTIDLKITCDKLHENLEDSTIHDYEHFLETISIPETSRDHWLPVVTCISGRDLQRLLKLAMDGDKIKFRVVVVTPAENQKDLSNLLDSKPAWKEVILLLTENMGWDELTPSHQNRIIKKLERNFSIEIPEDVEIDQVLRGQTLADLINDQSTTLFHQTIPKQLGYYVSRYLLTRSSISEEIFGLASPDILVFTGIQRYELSGYVKDKVTDNSSNQLRKKALSAQFIILEYPSHFNGISKLTDHPVHWLMFQNGRFTWAKSHGGVKTIQEYIHSAQEPFGEDHFYQRLDPNSIQPLLIADSPGMGKSVLLAKMGSMLAQSHPDKTILFVAVSEFVTHVKKLAGSGSHSQTLVQAIAETLQNLTSASELGNLVLQFKMDSSSDKRIATELLLDGFDELNSTDFQLGYEILQVIRTSFRSIRLWVTSRPHLLVELEVNLDTLGYTIEPFNQDNQIQFLTSFWTYCHNEEEQGAKLDPVKLQQYAMDCLTLLKSKMNKKEDDIAGIPLQCLLIGEVYEDEATTYASAEQNPINPSLITSITDLYERLIHKKIYKYLTAHTGSELKTAPLLMDMHVRLSVELIFPEHVGKLEEAFGPVEMREIVKVGIVGISGSTGSPTFLHRTFAEYFIASYVAWFEKPEIMEIALASLDSYSNAVGINSYQFVHPVVCYFINSLAELPPFRKHYSLRNLDRVIGSQETMHKIAHSCVNADLHQIFDFFYRIHAFREHEEAIFSRQFLQLVIEKSSFELFKVALRLIEKRAQFDKALKMEALRAAVRRGQFSTVEYLINARRLRKMLETLNKEMATLIHDCVEDSRSHSIWEIDQKMELIKMIIGINQKLLETRNGEGQTPIICKHVHSRLLLLLVELGGNVLAQDAKNDTILHFRNDRNNMSCEEYHTILLRIPDDLRRELVMLKGQHGHSPLWSVLDGFDPTEATLNWFMKSAADFNSLDDEGSSLLETAVRKGRNGKVIQKLIECGAEVLTWKGKNGETLTHVAAQYGNLEAIHILLDVKGMDLNEEDADGHTPLDLAIKSDFKHGNRQETGMALYDAGGQFKETVNSTGRTWLHVSAKEGNLQSIQLLVNIGLDVNFPDGEGNTPFHSLMMSWAPSKVPIVELLLEHEADLDLENKMGETPFHLALLLADQLDMGTFKLLKSRTNSEWSPSLANLALNILIANGKDLVDEEFDKMAAEMEMDGADYSFRDDHGNSQLHLAIYNNHPRAIFLLLNKQEDVNAVNNQQKTPLLLAAGDEMGLDAIKIIIKLGGDIYAKDRNDRTFLHEYIWHRPQLTDFDHLVRYLVGEDLIKIFNVAGGEHGVTPFHVAVYELEPQEEILSLLHSNGVDFNAVDKSGVSVLGYAVRGRMSVPFISSLIRLGADWKGLTRDRENMLHLSAQQGTSETLNLFLSFNGLDVNEVDIAGNTAMHNAVTSEGKEDVMEKFKILVENGADPNIKNVKGRTPLQQAQLQRDDDIYKELSCLFVNLNQNPSDQIMLVEGREPEAINLESIKCMIENGVSVFDKDDKDYTLLHNFILQADTPTPSEFHSVCAYLADKGLSDVLNTQGGKLGRSPFQEAVRHLEPDLATLSLLRSKGIHFHAVDTEGDSILFSAVKGKRTGDFLATLVIEYSADMTTLNKKKESLLHCSVKDGTVDHLKFLLDWVNLDENGQDWMGNSPLHTLVISAEEELETDIREKYRLLLGVRANVNSSNISGKTPLHSSTENRRKSMTMKLIQWLIEDGADVHPKDNQNYTFLHRYILNPPKPTPSEFHEIVEYLHEKGHIHLFNEQDDAETTPILHLVQALEPQEKTLTRLHSAGVNFNAVDWNGDSILTYAVRGDRDPKFILELITRFGVNATDIGKNDHSLLHLIASFHSAESLKFFLDVGLALPQDLIGISNKDKYGGSPLHEAVRNSTGDILQKCRLLVGHGADVNAKDNLDHTPLHTAAECGNKEVTLHVLKYLIEQGAEVFAMDPDDSTFLHKYFDTESVPPTPAQVHSLVEYLLNKDFAGVFNIQGGGMEQTPLQLMMGCLELQPETLSLLHARGVNFNVVDGEGDSLLGQAIMEERSTGLLSSLLNQFGADYRVVNGTGENLLHIAAAFGGVGVLKLFVGLEGLDVNERNEFGKTPLFLAVCPTSGKMDVLEKCKLLVGKGADVRIASDDGETPLTIVSKSYGGEDREELIELLRGPGEHEQVSTQLSHSSNSDSGSED